jgi:hypothetical protein
MPIYCAWDYTVIYIDLLHPPTILKAIVQCLQYMPITAIHHS